MQSTAKELTIVTDHCAHCDLPVQNSHKKKPLSDKVFCCEGCETVYSILKENGLSGYYGTAEKPGISFLNRNADTDFTYLDNPSITEKLVVYKSSAMSRVLFTLPAIHCAACVWLLEKLSRLEKEILYSRINYLKKEILIEYSGKIALSKVVSLLAQLGYPPDLNLGTLHKKVKLPERQLLMRLGLAGFAFGNIMLFSLPEYLDMKIDKLFSNIFSGLNLLLSFPVLFYSASLFFENAYRGLKQKRMNMDVPVALGILAMYLRSIFDIISGEGPGYLDSFAGLVFLLLIGRYLQTKTFLSLQFDREYRSFFPLAATLVLPNGAESKISVNQLQARDTIRCRNGEIVPADSQLLSEVAWLDYSFITGEALPVQKKEGDEIKAGGCVSGNSALFSIRKSVSMGHLSQLWNTANPDKETAFEFNSLIARISPVFTYTVLLIASLSGIFWLVRDVSMGLKVFTGILIIACPCALSMATPFTLGSTLNILSRNGLYLKSTSVIERFFTLKNIVFDKTGTLTWSGRYQINFEGTFLNNSEKVFLYHGFSESTHPLSVAISKFLKKDKLNTELQSMRTNFREFPGKGFIAWSDDLELTAGNAVFINEKYPGESKKIDSVILPKFTSAVYVLLQGKFRGVFVLSSQFRENLEGMLGALRSRFRLSVLSGDKALEKELLQKYFKPFEEMVFEANPEDKRDFLLQKNKSGDTLMLGDGINDSGALFASTIGVAVSEQVGMFTPQCDGILDAQEMSRFHKLLSFAQFARSTIIFSFSISFLYNVVGLYYAIQGKISPLFCAIIMPLSSITVILFSWGITRLTAIFRGLK